MAQTVEREKKKRLGSESNLEWRSMHAAACEAQASAYQRAPVSLALENNIFPFFMLKMWLFVASQTAATTWLFFLCLETLHRNNKITIYSVRLKEKEKKRKEKKGHLDFFSFFFSLPWDFHGHFLFSSG